MCFSSAAASVSSFLRPSLTLQIATRMAAYRRIASSRGARGSNAPSAAWLAQPAQPPLEGPGADAATSSPRDPLGDDDGAAAPSTGGRLGSALALLRRSSGRLARVAEPVLEFFWALRRARTAPVPVLGADFMRTELLLTLSAAPLRIIGGPRTPALLGLRGLCGRGSAAQRAGGPRVVLDGAYISCARQDPARIAEYLAKNGLADLAPLPHPSVLGHAAAPPLAGADAAVPDAAPSAQRGLDADEGSAALLLSGDLTASAYGPLSENGAGGDAWDVRGIASSATTCCVRRAAGAPHRPATAAAPSKSGWRPASPGGVSVGSAESDDPAASGVPEALWAARQAVPASRGTVIYCNPNAGLFEYAHKQCEWVDFYTALGACRRPPPLALLLLRGRSHGPAPRSLRRLRRPPLQLPRLRALDGRLARPDARRPAGGRGGRRALCAGAPRRVDRPSARGERRWSLVVPPRGEGPRRRPRRGCGRCVLVAYPSPILERACRPHLRRPPGHGALPRWRVGQARARVRHALGRE